MTTYIYDKTTGQLVDKKQEDGFVVLKTGTPEGDALFKALEYAEAKVVKEFTVPPSMCCTNCIYWNEKHTLYSYENKFLPKINLCDKAVEAWEATEWQKDEDGDVGYTERVLKEEHKDLKMFTQDGSSYHAALYTREDFFCAHFEHKED